MPIAPQTTPGDDCPPERTAGIDWFRRKVSDPNGVRHCQDAARALQHEDIEAGEPLKDWQWQGYTGKRTPRIRWGRKGRNLFWETSGAWAAHTTSRMPLSYGHSTRIDLQLTLAYSQPQPAFGTRSLPPEAMTHPRRLPSGIPVGLTTGADGMWLGTVGQRKRPEYFRLYDKGVETRTRTAGHIWRVELETKHEAAEALGCLTPELLLDPTWCARYVTSRWASLGCISHWDAGDGSLARVAPVEKPEPSSAMLLHWMERSVKPVVERLVRAGKVDQVIVALGLANHAIPRGSDSA